MSPNKKKFRQKTRLAVSLKKYGAMTSKQILLLQCTCAGAANQPSRCNQAFRMEQNIEQTVAKLSNFCLQVSKHKQGFTKQLRVSREVVRLS